MSKTLTRDEVVESFQFDIAYVPSKFDPKGENRLNYRVKVSKGAQTVYDGPYSMGLAHIPNYNALLKATNSTYSRTTLDGERLFNQVLANGKSIKQISYNNWLSGEPILPARLDVMHSLIMDGYADDARSYEEWAGDYGYDTDSIKGLRVFEACAEVGRALRVTMGAEWVMAARGAFQDY